jgi:hypothetical protein
MLARWYFIDCLGSQPFILKRGAKRAKVFGVKPTSEGNDMLGFWSAKHQRREMEKRQRTAALQKLPHRQNASEIREASWSAPALWRFGTAGGAALYQKYSENAESRAAWRQSAVATIRARLGCSRPALSGRLLEEEIEASLRRG